MSEIEEQESKEESYPHPQWTFNVPFSNEWLSCPECHSSGVSIQTRFTEPNVTQSYQLDMVLWFECLGCGEKSSITAPMPVKQPEEEPDTLLGKVLQIVK